MIGASSRLNRRWLAPEVVQTSAMDCGPASLKCLLEGFGISASYGRLREACQTDVDGTSIDTIEEVARQLGLEAEQIMIPADHLLIAEANTLPALVVVRLPNGLTHFAVVWRRVGPFVQVMDPATGRRWITANRLLDDLYIHTLPVPAEAWREWAGSAEFLDPLRHRLADLGLEPARREQLINTALIDPAWSPLATLDAATRMVDAVVRSGGLPRGRQASRALVTFIAQEKNNPSTESLTIPAAYWSVRPASFGGDSIENLFLRGAVLVRVRGRRPVDQFQFAAAGEPPPDLQAPLSPELVAALEEDPNRPGRELLRLLQADGLLAPSILLLALLLAAASIIIEALLFRSLLELGQMFGLVEQRFGAIGPILLFVGALLLLEWSLTTGALRLGRRLEMGLRIAFLKKIPRLGDRYFQSRPSSDMAERSHSVHRLRLLPELGQQLLRANFELGLTAVGVIWLDPATAPWAILAAILAVGLPLAVQSPLVEWDLRVRTHAGALSRFYLDALLGLIAIRTHGAESAIRREYESLLVEWARASLKFLRASMVVEGIQFLIGFGLVAWLLFDHFSRFGETGGVLLLVYWALKMPVLGQEIVSLLRQCPAHRNVTLRLLEPLGAPEKPRGPEDDQAVQTTQIEASASPVGVGVKLVDVSVQAAGHTILSEINLTIKPGSHVAIVGPSGAGKSSLVGLLLGWHRPATGHVVVDGQPLDALRLARLRRETAWVDPAVQLWNRSFIDNLRYSSHNGSEMPAGWAIEQADLRRVLEGLPAGLQTSLGESGGLVSGGEGQRVRLGRTLLQSKVRLAILDEPFRGLDRTSRRDLLTRSRRIWSEATLFCITHDLCETLTFDRVVVIENGQIIEDGVPTELAKHPSSHYQALLRAEEAVRNDLWASSIWRRLRLEDGQLLDRVLEEGA